MQQGVLGPRRHEDLPDGTGRIGLDAAPLHPLRDTSQMIGHRIGRVRRCDHGDEECDPERQRDGNGGPERDCGDPGARDHAAPACGDASEGRGMKDRQELGQGEQQHTPGDCCPDEGLGS
jgi:hypothetical protein